MSFFTRIESILLPDRPGIMLPIWGRAKVTWTHLAIYINGATFLMMTSTWYKVAGVEVMDRYLGFHFAYWEFMTIVAVAIVLGAVFWEWRISMPSVFRAQQDLLYTSSKIFRGDIQRGLKWNRATLKKVSKLEKDMDEIKEQQEAILKQLEKLNRKDPPAPPIGGGGIFTV